MSSLEHAGTTEVDALEARVNQLEAENCRLKAELAASERAIDALREAYATQQLHLRTIVTVASMEVDVNDVY